MAKPLTPLAVRDINVINDGIQGPPSVTKLRPPSAVKRSAKILPLEEDLNEIEDSAEPILKKSKLDNTIENIEPIRNFVKSKLPKPGIKSKSLICKVSPHKISNQNSSRIDSGKVSAGKLRTSNTAFNTKNASIKKKANLEDSRNVRKVVTEKAQRQKFSHSTQPPKKLNTSRIGESSKLSTRKKSVRSTLSDSKHSYGVKNLNSIKDFQPNLTDWNALGLQLNAMQDEISKYPKWNLKSRMEVYDKAFGLLPAMHSTCCKAIEDKDNKIQQLLDENIALNDQLSAATSIEQQMKDKEVKFQQEVQGLQDEINNSMKKYEYEIELLKLSKENLQRDRESLGNQLSVARNEASTFQQTITKMTAETASIMTELSTARSQLETKSAECRRLNQAISKKEEEILNYLSTLEDKDVQIRKAHVEAMSITNDLNGVRIQLEAKIGECQRLNQVIEKLEQDIRNYLATIQEKDAELRSGEAERRKLHNCVQELKGNIRVFCRVRPLTNSEGAKMYPSHIIFAEGSDANIKLLQSSHPSDTPSTKGNSNKYEFKFDKVFHPDSSQENVFNEVSQLVQSALDGYNVCIFAYGQTGSGKTYTMEGPPVSDNVNYTNVGIIPRAVAQIFNSAKDLKEKGWKYHMEASFLEIYNETIRDLLGSNNNVKHEIRLTPDKKDVKVTNLTIVNVTTEDEVHKLLAKATQNRAVAATECNERSSRSHSVFRLKLIGENTITNENCEGTLNLIDLAGSERVFVSKSTGERLTEAKSINKSLSNLGIVILALANKDSHIPYRNSKLTYLLQNSLGGNSKTLMFVNISPYEVSFQESLNSLRFATTVNNCHIGTATKKIK
ncbi:Carboxy-terminal kinesin 2 [Trichoplax sp. H2]|nr:Carboxy-terminal kinesin 2 [Trichoplax sp. H2]|eukprot:RDD38313.1 Carboxy-terminal kinesin 2 [Trichoplax sp. H2]